MNNDANQTKERVFEMYSVINDIFNEADQGKITWDEALEQIKDEIAFG